MKNRPKTTLTKVKEGKAPVQLKGALHKGYFQNLENYSMLTFLYNPESFSITRNINYTEEVAPGVSYPTFQYVSGGAKEITLPLFVQGWHNEPRFFINAYNNFIPRERSDFQFRKPPRILFAFGNYVKEVIIVSFRENYEEFYTHDLEPQLMRVDFTLKVVS